MTELSQKSISTMARRAMANYPTTTHYRVIPSQEVRAYCRGGEHIAESCHLDPLVARERAEHLAYQAAQGYVAAQNQTGWERKGDCGPPDKPPAPYGEERPKTHTRFVRWRAGTPELEARTLTLKPGDVVRGEQLTEPLTCSTGDQFSPEGTPQSVKYVVPLQAQHAYVPLAHHAELDDEGRVLSEWHEPLYAEPLAEHLTNDGKWRTQDEWSVFCGCRKEQIYWGVKRPPKWRHGLAYWTLAPQRSVPYESDGGEWFSYPTLVTAQRRAKALLLRALEQERAKIPEGWRDEGPIDEKFYSSNGPEWKRAQTRPRDRACRADRICRIGWGKSDHGMTCTVEWEKLEQIVEVEVRGRLDDDGRLVDRREVEVGELPDLDDPDLIWETSYSQVLRVAIHKDVTVEEDDR